MENRHLRDAWPGFRAAGVALRGIGTQLPNEEAEFARAERIPRPLLSGAAHRPAAALRLPAFRGAGRLRHRRLILVVDAERAVRDALFPVDDIPYAVAETQRPALARLSRPSG